MDSTPALRIRDQLRSAAAKGDLLRAPTRPAANLRDEVFLDPLLLTTDRVVCASRPLDVVTHR